MNEEIIEVEEEIDEEEIELEEELCVYNQPHGTIEITTNGTHDVGQYENANVSVLPNMQDKSVTITTNGTTTITKDEGYDGLNNVEVTTSVSPNLQNKSVSITENGTIIVSKDEGYEGLNNVEITTNVVSENNIKSGQIGYVGMSANVRQFITDVTSLDISQLTQLNGLFQDFKSLVNAPQLDTSNISTMVQAFGGCSSLVTAPTLNTSKVYDAQGLYMNCSSLVNVPIYDTKNIKETMGTQTRNQNMFSGCPSLSNESLNNILRMCINMGVYSSHRTLRRVGLSSDQATICQSLSNWNDFVAAGWTTGY